MAEVMEAIQKEHVNMSITYKESVTVDEVNAIRKAKGWMQLHPDELQASLDGSTLIAAAYEEKTIVGMTRLMWDGGSVALIPYIIVMPQYDEKEIKDNLLARVLGFLRAKLKPGYGIQVDIKAWSGEIPQFESLGFKLSLPERRGTLMHICLTEQIELTDKMFGQGGFKKT